MMKKLSILALVICLPVLLEAQIDIPIEQTRKVMSKGDQPGFLVRIPESSLTDAEKLWMREVRKGSKAKPSKSKEEISIQAAMLESIRRDPVNVYARFYQDGNDVLLYSFYEIDSVFFDGIQQPDLAGNIRNYLRGFAVQTYRESFEKRVKVEEKQFQRLEKEIISLESQNKKSDRNISKNNRSISDLQQKIKEITADEERKAAEIERQKSLIATLENFPEEQKMAKSKLKSLEKERRKLKRSRESSHKRIDKLDENIKDYHRNIRIAEERISQQNKDIQQQRDKVLQMKTKLAGIR